MAAYRSIDLSKFNYTLISFADRKDVEEVIQEYANNIAEPSNDDASTLMEQFNILKARGHNAKEWLIRIFHELSKKDNGKKSMNYLIGMIRNRSTYGWGSSRSIEERVLINKTEQLLGKTLSQEGLVKIYNMMGNFGAARVALGLHGVDIEKLFLDNLESQIKSQETEEN
jgi:hypothetical protein